MKIIGKNQISERQILRIFLPAMEASLLQEIPNAYFCVFVLCDSNNLDVDTIFEFAENLLSRAAVYFSFWGKDCERVHDIFDEAISIQYPSETEHSVRMTTWHSDESIDEALWFFLNVAFPAHDYSNNCNAELIIVIENEEWKRHIEERVLDQKNLSKDVIGD